MSHHSLTGTIPAQLGLLSSMTQLGIQNNRMKGSIPSTLGALTKLVILHLDNQATGYYSSVGLTGIIPSTFAALTILQFLNVGYNRLSGTVPSFFGLLTHLTELDLDVNYFTGQAPSSICALPALASYQFSINDLCCYASCYLSHQQGSAGNNFWVKSYTPYNLTHDQRKQRGHPLATSNFVFRVIPDCNHANGGCVPTPMPTVSFVSVVPTAYPSTALSGILC